MAMHKLTYDEGLCVRCGNCEAILPKMLESLASGSALISPANMREHGAEIHRSVASCHLDALTLTEVE
ncbi:MAG: hypothetical protein ACOY8P_07850 [Thermodesulfobacteriota bacterium]